MLKENVIRIILVLALLFMLCIGGCSRGVGVGLSVGVPIGDHGYVSLGSGRWF